MNKMYSVFNDKSDSIQAEALDRFSAMEKQERGAIRKNYFLDLDQQEFKEPNSSYIDTKCRTDMIEWEIKVARYFNFDISTVFHSVSYLDRYLSISNDSSKEVLCSRQKYQLSCMTCYYIAIKLHEPKVIGLSFLVELGQNTFTQEDFKNMERKILFALDFHMMIPTPICFARTYLDLKAFQYPNGIKDMIGKAVISEISSFLSDVSFITSNYSDIAISTVEKCARHIIKSNKLVSCESVSVIFHQNHNILSH